MFKPGDIVAFKSPVAGYRKWHLCVNDVGWFLHLNSPKDRKYKGDLEIECGELPGVPHTESGKSVVLAAFGWLNLAAAPHPTGVTQPEKPDTDQAIAAALNKIANTNREEAERAQRSRETEPCEKGEEKRYSDLCAQWKAADAATLAAWLSGASFAAVLVALYLAFRSNAIARDTGKRQLRAYISIAEGGIKLPTMKSMQAVIILKNAGQTPAYKFCGGIEAVARAPDHHIAIGRPADGLAPLDLGPGQGHQLIHSPLLTDEEIAGIKRGQLRLFVLISCEFSDSFGEPQKFKACLRQNGAAELSPYPYADGD